MPKYFNKRTEYNGRVYDSKKEADYARQLDIKKSAGVIKNWIPQPSFPLSDGVRYMPDFMVIHNDGTFEVIDVKAWDKKKRKFRETPTSRLKRKQMYSFYGIEVELA